MGSDCAVPEERKTKWSQKEMRPAPVEVKDEVKAGRERELS
jgi:hypothetical protein